MTFSGETGLVSVGGASPVQFPQLVVLDSAVARKPRWCAFCAREETFVEVYEFAGGRFGYCWGCGEEKCVPFSRTMEAG